MDNKLNKKRTDYISWEEYFMAIAKLSAMRSKDPSTQVGACIVSNDNRILSIGYNGAPNGFSDDEFPWDREGKNLDTKYPYVCHAELNAILNADTTATEKALNAFLWGARCQLFWDGNKRTSMTLANKILIQ